ncbi:unnamed protein product, partial [Larinioides sclopetarius]
PLERERAAHPTFREELSSLPNSANKRLKTLLEKSCRRLLAGRRMSVDGAPLASIRALRAHFSRERDVLDCGRDLPLRRDRDRPGGRRRRLADKSSRNSKRGDLAAKPWVWDKRLLTRYISIEDTWCKCARFVLTLPLLFKHLYLVRVRNSKIQRPESSD